MSKSVVVFKDFIRLSICKASLDEDQVAHVARSYARSCVVDPDNHLDAVESIASDFICGVEYAKNCFSIAIDLSPEYSD